jgi:hypothetical protein
MCSEFGVEGCEWLYILNYTPLISYYVNVENEYTVKAVIYIGN